MDYISPAEISRMSRIAKTDVVAIVVNCMLLPITSFAFSALTLLVGRQEGQMVVV